MTTIENHEGNVENVKEKMTYGRDAIEWRRTQVLELSSQGYSHREIVSKLQIAKGTVSSDLAFIKKRSIENLQKHIHEVVPMEYQKCMIGMKIILKDTREIAATSSDPAIKLQANNVAKDCYKSILDMSTNAGIVSDAMKFVQAKTEEITTLTTLQKMEQRIDITEGEEGTANGIY